MTTFIAIETQLILSAFLFRQQSATNTKFSEKINLRSQIFYSTIVIILTMPW